MKTVAAGRIEDGGKRACSFVRTVINAVLVAYDNLSSSIGAGKKLVRRLRSWIGSVRPGGAAVAAFQRQVGSVVVYSQSVQLIGVGGKLDMAVTLRGKLLKGYNGPALSEIGAAVHHAHVAGQEYFIAIVGTDTWAENGTSTPNSFRNPGSRPGLRNGQKRPEKRCGQHQYILHLNQLFDLLIVSASILNETREMIWGPFVSRRGEKLHCVEYQWYFGTQSLAKKQG